MKASINFLIVVLIASLFSCTKAQMPEDNPQVVDPQVETPIEGDIDIADPHLSTYYFDWNGVDWMPLPSLQARVSQPWIGAGTLHGSVAPEDIADRDASDGWELIYSVFDPTASSRIENPYFIIYNKYRGILRLYQYVTDVHTINLGVYLHEKVVLSTDGQASSLNFLGEGIIDATNNKDRYSQIKSSPYNNYVTCNKWYMTQYEMAYDESLQSARNASVKLAFMQSLVRVDNAQQNGVDVSQYYGQFGSDFFSAENIVTKSAGASRVVLSAIGSSIFIDAKVEGAHSLMSNNRYNIPNDDYESLVDWFETLSAEGDNDLTPLVANAVWGGSRYKAVSATLLSDLTIDGDIVEQLQFPVGYASIWMPGTPLEGVDPSYVPHYNKPLGVINFRGKPNVAIELIDKSFDVSNESADTGREVVVTEFYARVQDAMDFSEYLIVNPEVKKIADVAIQSQDVVFDVVGEGLVEVSSQEQLKYKQYGNGEDYVRFDPKTATVGVRFKIKVTPHDGSQPSYIVKTFALNPMFNN